MILKKLIKSLKQYFTHKNRIPLGVDGEFSKIREEYLELEDAHEQKKAYFTIIECADLITSVGSFSWRQYKIPFFLIIVLAYIRKPYKWIRNPFLRLKYKTRKSDFQYIGGKQ